MCPMALLHSRSRALIHWPKKKLALADQADRANKADGYLGSKRTVHRIDVSHDRSLAQWNDSEQMCPPAACSLVEDRH